MACAVGAIETQRNAIVIPELELCQIAVKVALAAVLINALHAAFDDAEIAFDRVAVDAAILKVYIFTAIVAGELR